MKNNHKFIITIIFIVLVAFIGIYAYSQSKLENSNTDNGTSQTEINRTGESAISKQYSALKGEAYDKAFLSGMVTNYSNLLNMSEMAGASTSRQEILDLAMEINSTQSQEMMTLMEMQEKNGYPVTNGHDMSNMGDAAESMDATMIMIEELQGLKAEAFDKKFLSTMIAIHQDIIDISKLAETNTQSSEIKSLAGEAIPTQQANITRLQQWQNEWT